MRPLNIPQSATGIETQLSMHLDQNTTHSLNLWSKFRLCAYENNQWHECCRGYIRVEYEGQVNQVSGKTEVIEELKAGYEMEAEIIESCHGDIDPVTLYQALNGNGFAYGPAFRQVTKGVFGVDGRAVGEVHLFEWPSNEHPQDHVIHPASLDAIFHLSLAAIADGGRKPVPTMVPSSLRGLWIRKTGCNSDQSAAVRASTWVAACDNRGSEFNQSVLSLNRDVILAQVRGLRLTKVAEVSTEDLEDHYHNHQSCFHVTHEPDPMLLDINLISSHLCRNVEDTRIPLDHYMRLLAHKIPMLQVLDISSDQELTADVLRALSVHNGSGELITTRYHSYHYTSSSEITLNHARQEFQRYPHIVFKVLDIVADPVKQGLENEKYDLVIVGDSLPVLINTRNGLQHVRKLLHPHGQLLLREQAQIDVRQERLTSPGSAQEAISGNGFKTSLLEISMGEGNDSPEHLWTIATKYQNELASHDKRVVFVIEPSSEFQMIVVQKLTQKVASQNVTDVKALSLNDASKLTGKNEVVFVFLKELDQSLLYDMSLEDYSSLQHLLMSAPNILWTTRYGGAVPRKPDFAIISGLARVLRNEHQNHRFTTVSFELHDLWKDEQSTNLIKVLELNHFITEPRTFEPEYKEMEGVLSIPRISQATGSGRELYLNSLPRRSRTSIIQETPPLSLTVGTPRIT